MEEIIGFIIWEIVTCIYLIIAIKSWRSEEAVGFFNVTKPPKIKEDQIVKYNHAVAKLWFFFTVVLAVSGIPLLFITQNSMEAAGYAIAVCIGVPIVIIGMVISYIRIEIRYRES